MVLIRHIKSTKSFIGSNCIIKRMILSKTNFISINNNYKKAKEIGFDKWIMGTKAQTKNQEIIKELLIIKKQ